MAKEQRAVTVTLMGGPEDGLSVDVPVTWKAYRPPNAKGAYKPRKRGATQWHWVPDPELA